MGSVSAKEIPKPQNMIKIPQDQAPGLDFNKNVRVDKININGLGRTKNDLVVPIVKELFVATNFGEVLLKADRVNRRLENLECFRNIDIQVDTSKGPKATKDGVEVTFNVKEMRRIVGNVNVTTGNEEASLVLGARMPNLFGRAEKLQAEYNHGSKSTTNLGLSLSKPFVNQYNTSIKSSIYQMNANLPSSGYKELDRGSTAELTFDSAPQVHHTIQWEGVWRQLSCLSRTVPMEVREESGHSLKSAISHTISMDRRNKKVFPTKGTLFEWKTEYAGVGGDVGFLKNDVKAETNLSIFKDFVLQTTLQGGLMTSVNDKKVHICDRYFLGGPTSIRGFETRGAGPHIESCAIGSEVYWAGGVHMYAPLPFRVFEKSFGELFRSHVFVNAGNVATLDSGRDYREFFKQMVNGTRMSCGVGLALRLGSVARLELNYCLPLSLQPGDRAQKGFQFGVGMSFL